MSTLRPKRYVIFFSAYVCILCHCGPAGEKFGDHSLTKVVNAENAEIDDLSVVRDGDTLFLLQVDSESSECN